MPMERIKKNVVNDNKPNPIKLVKKEKNTGRTSWAEFEFM